MDADPAIGFISSLLRCRVTATHGTKPWGWLEMIYPPVCTTQMTEWYKYKIRLFRGAGVRMGRQVMDDSVRFLEERDGSSQGQR
jgi:hypothetical protein